MAVPSGAGSEVLKRMSTHITSGTTIIDWAQIIQTTAGNSSGTTTIPADHIYTILSVNLCNTAGSASRNVHMWIEHSGEDDMYILHTQAIGGTETFVYTDKFVMREGDVLKFNANGADVQVWISYIDQHF